MEILELALSLELDLEKYYNEQAEKNKENSLHVVFTMLADEEEKHANILLGKADKLTLKFEDNSILIQARSLFQNIKDFKSEFTDIPSQLDSYRFALEMEQKSKKFYKELYDTVEDEKTKETYGYLVHQEDLHCIIMEELVKLTTRPEEWVESAEFGLREDY
jgi:rubrerythrin